MAYQFKSKTLQALQAKKDQQAKEIVSKVAQDFNRLKETVEELEGERGSDRAVRQSDFSPTETVRLKSSDVTDIPSVQEFNRLREDVVNLYRLLAKIAGE